MDEGINIPEPHPATGKNIHFIAPAASVQAALLVHQARGNRSLADLARAIETSSPSVCRCGEARTASIASFSAMTAFYLSK
jgi:antitoxin HicB